MTIAPGSPGTEGGLVAFVHVLQRLRSIDLAAVMTELGTSEADTALWRLASDIKDALELHDQIVRDL